MGEPKSKETTSLRQPKPKKTLGLHVRPMPDIGSPHADLIKPADTLVTTPVATPATTPVDTPVATPAIETVDKLPQYLDATHTPSEAQVYSVMYRETVSRNLRDRHFGPAELMKKTGIRSDRTVRRAIDGLLAKLSIEIISYTVGSQLGPRYRIFKPREIEQRRKAVGMEIDPQSKQIVTPVATPATTPVATGGNSDRGTPANFTGVTPANFTGVYKYINDQLAGTTPGGSSSNVVPEPDDEAFAELLSLLKQTSRELTGKPTSPVDSARWRELGELLVAELKIAAARTGQVSNVPAFLTEHLRRRLWKKDKAQLERESREAPAEAAPAVDASKCEACGGSGWHYPEGPEHGVAKCRHEKLRAEPQTDS